MSEIKDKKPLALPECLTGSLDRDLFLLERDVGFGELIWSCAPVLCLPGMMHALSNEMTFLAVVCLLGLAGSVVGMFCTLCLKEEIAELRSRVNILKIKYSMEFLRYLSTLEEDDISLQEGDLNGFNGLGN